MEKKAVWFFTGFTIFFCALFILINRDLFSFDQTVPVHRSFSLESDSTGNHPITAMFQLTKGEYRITFSGINEDDHNGYVIFLGDEIWLTDTFNTGELNDIVNIVIENPLADVRFGVYYFQSDNEFRIEYLRISSDWVISKENILRHLVRTICLLALYLILILRFCFPKRYKTMFGRFSNPASEKTFLYLLLLTLIISAPLFHPGFLQSTDLFFHLMRIEGIHESLLSGYFPARIHLYTLGDYGYGAGLYYPDYFLYFPALLRILGFGIIPAYKIFTIFLNFFTVLTMYLFVSRTSKSRFAGLVSATFYGLAAYRLIAIYYRGALSEVLAFVFLPLICWGLYGILNHELAWWRILAAGFTGLILSHLISVAIAGITVLLILILYFDRLPKNREIFWGLFRAFLLTLGLSAFFWVPMLEQVLMNPVKADFLFSTQQNAINPVYLLTLPEIFSGFIRFTNIFQRLYFGYPLLLVPFVFPFLAKRNKMQGGIFRFSTILVAIGVLFLCASTNIFPWERFAWLYNRIQFPWRLLMIPMCCFSAVAGFLWESLFRRKHKIVILTTLIVCVAGSLPLLTDVVRYNIYPSEDFRLEDNRISGAEWLPLRANGDFIDKNKNTVLASVPDFSTRSFDRNGLRFSLDFELQKVHSQKITVEIPLLYYTGYRACLLTEEYGEQRLPVSQGPHGLTSVEIDPDIRQGTIQVWYQKTTAQIVSELFSLLLVILIIGFFVLRKKLVTASQPFSPCARSIR